MAVGDSITYSYTGALQTTTLLAGKRYLVELFGASGKGPSLGGYAFGELQFETDTLVNIYVGGSTAVKAGGWNGGGSGAGSSLQGGGGGGASDIRVGGTALANRIIVAGGGGGKGYGSPTIPRWYSFAGGLVGGDGNYQAPGVITSIGRGGTQEAGGAGSINAGTLGIGGAGSGSTSGGGGGGGGYYGGGGSGTYCNAGGGSSYVGGVINGGTVQALNSGNGIIIITELAAEAQTFVAPVTYNYTGHPQAVFLKKGKYKIECYGGKGGVSLDNYAGGAGGYCKGEFEFLSDTHIALLVGGAGGNAAAGAHTPGGWNGGGYGKYTSGGSVGGGGGGASDVRIGGGLLQHRILVAGGGGGGGAGNVGAGIGGAGGGAVGSDGGQYLTQTKGIGGSQLAGGAADGQLGIGGDGARYGGYNAGGGGAGYYGGGVPTGNFMSGAGGSSYYGTLENPVTTTGVNTGNGYIIITPLNAKPKGSVQMI